ncbi:hypothetical protein CI610_00391 [invertebrate metagenome]|uniref:Uncharacterized protein n=1 Tax=invertebrate metagenome TaxID=1711999 RepID=A0A2H9TBP3_9ZZZZ
MGLLDSSEIVFISTESFLLYVQILMERWEPFVFESFYRWGMNELENGQLYNIHVSFMNYVVAALDQLYEMGDVRGIDILQSLIDNCETPRVITMIKQTSFLYEQFQKKICINHCWDIMESSRFSMGIASLRVLHDHDYCIGNIADDYFRKRMYEM